MDTQLQARATFKFIHSGWFDSIFILGSPLIALLIILLTCEPRGPGGSFILPEIKPAGIATLAAIMINMHVLLVVARSHFNQKVFSRFPLRFTWVPLALFAVMSAWLEFFIFMVAVVTIWDEYHSFMQTFGFGRLYEQVANNTIPFARRMDMAFCFGFEYLPYIFVLVLLPRPEFIQELNWGTSPWVIRLSEFASLAAAPLLVLAVLMLGAYILRYVAFRPRGYTIPINKFILFGLTGLVNLYVISRYTFFEATILGNIYHAIQYFAIMWISERKNVVARAGVSRSMVGQALLYSGIFGTLLGLAFLRVETASWAIFGALWLTTSLMHFWYDGFIWSVRRGEVALTSSAPRAS